MSVRVRDSGRYSASNQHPTRKSSEGTEEVTAMVLWRDSNQDQRQTPAAVISGRERRLGQPFTEAADGEHDMVTTGSFRDGE